MKNFLKSCKIQKNFLLTPLIWFPIWAISIAKDKPVYKTKQYLTFTFSFLKKKYPHIKWN
jgi:hypothetical protein